MTQNMYSTLNIPYTAQKDALHIIP